MTATDEPRAFLQAIASGMAHFREGRLPEAEASFRDILAVDPDNVTALERLGHIAARMGRHPQALDFFCRALQSNPGDAAMHCNLGTVFQSLSKTREALACYLAALELDPGHAAAYAHAGAVLRLAGIPAADLRDFRAPGLKAVYAEAYKKLGVALAGLNRWDAALACFRKALHIDPAYADGHVCVGNVMMAQGRLDEAVASFHKALALNPDSAIALNNLGIALRGLGSLDEAEACFRRAMALDPAFADACNNLGIALHARGEPDEALRCFERALTLNPGFIDAHNNLGITLQEIGRPGEALVCYCRAVTLSPGYAKAYKNMGTALSSLGRSPEALVSYRRALALDPDDAALHMNMGNALQALGLPEQALAAYRRALALQPGNAMVHSNMGIALQSQGNLDAALASYRRALEIKPDSANVQWNLAIALLLRGDLADGLALYEQRFAGTGRANAQALAKFAARPRWQGEDLRGKTLLLWNEQGLGDAIMLLRYLPQLKAKGVREIIVYCQPALLRLARTFAAAGRVIDDRSPLPLDAVAYHCPLMSLPYLFGTRLETIVNAVPYIRVPSGMADKWAQRLAPLRGLKVGLAWAGSRTQRRDLLRSIPLARLAPLLAVPGVQFISLQKEEAAAANKVLDWMAECEDFLDTAALVLQLDLVISVDTAVAHLAGALGKPVWLLNRFDSDWRWMLEREDSPWYPTLRIFRQTVPRDWDSVLARVAGELRLLASERTCD